MEAEQSVVRQCINCGHEIIFKQIGNRRVPVNANNESVLHYDVCKAGNIWWWGEFIKQNKSVISKMFPNRG